jgi:hypothetical protein
MKTNKPKTKIITGCNDCPFCLWGGVNAYCIIENGRTEKPIEVFRNDFDNIVTPAWCPLKIQPVIVTYET